MYFLVIGIIMLVVIMGVLSLIHHSNDKEKQAFQIAHEYLSRHYEQEMLYLRTRHFSGIVGPELHRVYSSPTNNLDIIFEVIVPPDFNIPEPRSHKFWTHSQDDNDYEVVIRSDSYYLRHFEWLVADFFEEEANKTWDGYVNVRVSYSNHPPFAFSVPPGFNDILTLEEMVLFAKPLENRDSLTGYFHLYVDIDKMLGEKKAEAEKIFEFFQAVREIGYEPWHIILQYNRPRTMKDISGKLIINFSNWLDLTNANQVLEQIE